MLHLVELELGFPEGTQSHDSMGSILQGALMEIVSPEVAAMLHVEGVRPYSQYVYFDKLHRRTLWRIGTLAERAFEAIAEPVLSYGDELYLKNRGYAVTIKSKRVKKECSYASLYRKAFESPDVPSGVDISFLTPTSFKHAGHYEILPDIRRIFQSLLLRWNEFTSAMELPAGNLEAELAQACYIVQYELHSQIFSVDGKRLIGFGGTMRLRFGKNELANRLMGLLMGFAPFAGIGIKTAVGMGAVETKLLK